MKLLVKKIFNTRIIVFFRNLINFRPLRVSLNEINTPKSISDSFCWRTDQGFKTIFKYSDILGLFYGIKDSTVFLSFYNKKNILIKKLEIKDLNYSNTLEINSKLLGGIEDYGVFYIFHKTNSEINKETIISNRCYVGYSKNNNLYSFVHGNTYAKSDNIELHNKLKSHDIIKTSLNRQKYKIQNYFKDFTKTELFFANPTENSIDINIDNKKYYLEKRESLILEVSNLSSIIFNSNCLYLRPIIFNYKDNYFDVYHG